MATTVASQAATNAAGYASSMTAQSVSPTTPARPPRSTHAKRAEELDKETGLNGVGNYEFIKTLGEGNFAKVKLARHAPTGLEVAIKIIDKSQLDEKKLSKLYREVRIMKLLRHPHIVRLYEVIETKSTLFLVMESASGGELYDYLVVHGRMKEKEARAKFRQILSAVYYCHQKRVIHRDLKAENLLLDANLDIKIADFGFSNLYDPDLKLDTFCGSPPYAAPELFQGRRYTGPEVDMWSLGVILYVLTTGCLPFDGKNLQEMRESVCRGKYRIPFYLSDPCEKLLRKFLIRDPFKRASLEILIDDPWLNEGYAEPLFPKESLLGGSQLNISSEDDDIVLRIMESKFKLDRNTIQKSLQDSVYDDVAAIYHLLHHERQRESRGYLEDTSPFAPSAPESPLKASDIVPSTQNPLKEIAAFNAKPGESRNTDGAAPPANEPAGNSASHAAGQANMAIIAEDGANANEDTFSVTQVQRAVAAAKPRRRRFTVGGEAPGKAALEGEEAEPKNAGKTTAHAAAAGRNVPEHVREEGDQIQAMSHLSRGDAIAHTAIQEDQASSTGNGFDFAPSTTRPSASARQRPVSIIGSGSNQPAHTSAAPQHDALLPPVVSRLQNSASARPRPISIAVTNHAAPQPMPALTQQSTGLERLTGSTLDSNGIGKSTGGQTPPSQARADAGAVQTRKRTNTIVGMFRGHIKKGSEVPSTNGASISHSPSGSQSSAASFKGPAGQPADDTAAARGSSEESSPPASIGSTNAPTQKPRSLRFTFNSNTTSALAPEQMIQNVQVALNSLGIKYRLQTNYTIDCTATLPPVVTRQIYRFLLHRSLDRIR